MRKFVSALLCVAAIVVLAAAPSAAQTPAPTKLPTPTKIAPLARVTTPVRDQTVRGSISIQGSALAPNFAKYEIAYANEPRRASWTVIAGDVQMVDNGTLAVWNTRPISDSTYALRLQVFNADNTITGEFIVGNVSISNTLTSPTTANSGATNSTASTTTANSTTTSSGFDLGKIISDAASGFQRGVRYVAYALIAFGVYLLIKKFVGGAIRAARKDRIDYGR